MYQLAIFDMDGTILDTLEDLHDSLNVALEQWGYPQRTLKQVRGDVGNGIRNLIVRSLPEGVDQQRIQQVFDTFMPYYQLHCADKTHPYSGIREAIARLQERGVRCAVISNKADSAVQSLARTYFPGCFELAVGEHTGVPRKPAPDAVWNLLQEMGVQPGDGVYIGDSEVDYATAQNAGLDVIMVTWGFRDREDLQSLGASVFADRPEELVEIIAGKFALRG